MTGLWIEGLLVLWASSLRDVKARIGPRFTEDRVAASSGQFLAGFWAGCWGGARPKTGGLRLLVIPGSGGNRPVLVGPIGTQMRGPTLCGVMCWKRWPILMALWLSMRLAF